MLEQRGQPFVGRIGIDRASQHVASLAVPSHFDRGRGGFTLRSVHPGFSAADIRSQTGFDYVEPAEVPPTPLPDAETLLLLRGRIMDELAETYPAFARSMLQAA